MNNKTIITKTGITIDKYKHPLFVYHKTQPTIHNIKNCKYVELKDLSSYLTSYQDDIDLFIVDNLGKMITPANRCDQIWEHIYSGIKCDKLTIENQIYYVDEWRMWFVYGFLDTRIFGFATSFEAERQWNNKYNNVIDSIKSYTDCRINKQFDFDVTINQYSVSQKEQSEYEKIKTKLFDESKNIRQVLIGLHRYCKSLIPNYNLPFNLSDLYKFDAIANSDLFSNMNNVFTFNITNLKFDEYQLNTVLNLIKKSNELTEVLYNENLYR
jgi:hypothetical protein